MLNKLFMEMIAHYGGESKRIQHFTKMDYQILVEADFIVNLYEDNMEKNAVEAALEKIFKTAAGRKICSQMYGVGAVGKR